MVSFKQPGNYLNKNMNFPTQLNTSKIRIKRFIISYRFNKIVAVNIAAEDIKANITATIIYIATGI